VHPRAPALCAPSSAGSDEGRRNQPRCCRGRMHTAQTGVAYIRRKAGFACVRRKAGFACVRCRADVTCIRRRAKASCIHGGFGIHGAAVAPTWCLHARGGGLPRGGHTYAVVIPTWPHPLDWNGRRSALASFIRWLHVRRAGVGLAAVIASTHGKGWPCSRGYIQAVTSKRLHPSSYIHAVASKQLHSRGYIQAVTSKRLHPSGAEVDLAATVPLTRLYSLESGLEGGHLTSLAGRVGWPGWPARQSLATPALCSSSADAAVFSLSCLLRFTQACQRWGGPFVGPLPFSLII